MKIIKVTYRTSNEYAERNLENIKIVMHDLKQMSHPGISYHACLGQDGTTFIHTAFFKSDNDQKALQGLPSFQQFQKQLMASDLVMTPHQEILTLIGSSNNLFTAE